MNILGRVSRLNAADRRLLRRQHEGVQRTLLTTETAADGECPRDVAVVVIGQRATGINEQQISVLENGTVVDVVQHACILTTSNDGAVGRSTSSLLKEMLFDQRLNLALCHAWANRCPSQFMGRG